MHISGNSIGSLYDSGGSVLVQNAWQDNNIGLYYIPWETPLSYFKYVSLSEYENLVSAYLFTKNEGFNQYFWQNEFESLSGYSWPNGMDYIIREAIFYNPLFGPDFTDLIPYSAQTKAVIINLYDSFLEGDWSSPAFSEDSEGIIEEDSYDLARNRVNVWTTLGAGKSYTPIDINDGTEIKALVVFDAFCCNKYAGGIWEPKIGFNLQYRINDFLTGNDKAIFDLINLERTNESLSPLISNHLLQKAAERHAQDMAKNAMDSHIGSDGSTDYDRAEDEGYYINRPQPYCYLGENIGMFSSVGFTIEDLVQAWMNSPGHRENILFEDFTETGISIVMGEDNIFYACQVFGGKPGAWGGFGAFDTTQLETYINKNFTFNESMPEDFLKVYSSQKVRNY